MKTIFTNIEQVTKKYFPETNKEKEGNLLNLPPKELGRKLAIRALRKFAKGRVNN